VTGLIAAWPHAKQADPAEEVTPAEPQALEDPAADASTTEQAADSAALPLPVKYKAVGATFEKVDGKWVYTSDSEETHYNEVSRRGGNTVVFDPERQVYARWPNRGGKVEEKGAADDAEWESSFDIWLPENTQPTE
jgi:hypothetical protein